jgi:hypothetical protein
MKNYILFSTPRSCSTHICDLLGNHLISENKIKNNLYEYFNVYAWFFTYHQTTKQIVEPNSTDSYFVDYINNENGIIKETVFKNITRIIPSDRQSWMNSEINRREELLTKSEYQYLYKLFPLNLSEEKVINLLRTSNVIALTRRSVVEQILSLYFVQLNNNNYNIRDSKFALKHLPNSIMFIPTKYQGLLEKNLNRIREFNKISKMLSLDINYHEDLANLPAADILAKLGIKSNTTSLKSRYIPINQSGYTYYELVKNKDEVDSWFNTYAKDLME